MSIQTIAEQLAKSGLCIFPDFLAAAQVAAVRADLDVQYSAGRFRRAGIGHGTAHMTHDEVRRDEILWLDQEAPTSAQDQLWGLIDELKETFNRQLFLGLKKFEGHYAVYPPGGYYARHRDRFRDNDSRVISLVLYLNRDWQAQDGGCLRLYKQNEIIDVEPRGGTLVCFLSEEIEHEVLLNHSARFSFTGWYKT